MDLQTWIEAVGGLEAIYNEAAEVHKNNTTQLRECGLHFEWLIDKACFKLGFKMSKNHPDYKADSTIFSNDGVFPLLPKWSFEWREPGADANHPINVIAATLSDRRIEPYKGRVVYVGYGEDAGEPVRVDEAIE